MLSFLRFREALLSWEDLRNSTRCCARNYKALTRYGCASSFWVASRCTKFVAGIATHTHTHISRVRNSRIIFFLGTKKSESKSTPSTPLPFEKAGVSTNGHDREKAHVQASVRSGGDQLSSSGDARHPSRKRLKRGPRVFLLLARVNRAKALAKRGREEKKPPRKKKGDNKTNALFSLGRIGFWLYVPQTRKKINKPDRRTLGKRALIWSLKAKLNAWVGKYRITLVVFPLQKAAIPCSCLTRVKQLFFFFLFFCVSCRVLCGGSAERKKERASKYTQRERESTKQRGWENEVNNSGSGRLCT